MKTRKISFDLTVPAWLPKARDIRQAYKNVRYFLLPFRCSVTGKRLRFKYPQYEYRQRNHVRVLISTHGRILHRSEWIKYVQNYFASAPQVPPSSMYNSDHVQVQECNSCARVVETIGSAPDIRIGMQWWNGFRVCENCLTETIRLGEEKSSIIGYKRGRAVCFNEAGAQIATVPQSDQPTTIVPKRTSSKW